MFSACIGWLIDWSKGRFMKFFYNLMAILIDMFVKEMEG